MFDSLLPSDHESCLVRKKYLEDIIRIKPTVGIICGSGLGSLADCIQHAQIIHYSEIPDFPIATVQGHNGQFVFGTIGEVGIVLMQGRVHTYEGHHPSEVAIPIRVMRLLGVRILLVTNAAGGVNPTFNPGDVCVIKDQISLPNLIGFSPLMGPNQAKFGCRFQPMLDIYNRHLSNLLKESLLTVLPPAKVHEGVYIMLAGPCFETAAETRLLQGFGADVVGMSTANEVTVAQHCGMKICGFSLVTNKAVSTQNGDEQPPSHEEVILAASKSAQLLCLAVETFVKMIPQEMIN
ncbi:hypothetical protein Ciccas_007607 [Cichlidogyrus casuarinus]|uniref:Purine nucleoside phosphorylase n=1 Tax=Cichlidogyrus casuarinus TaxID=1844966 RepID=A0ABD2Q2F5_9PLAT